MRVWLNALSMESPQLSEVSPENVKESVKISLDFYPLCESSVDDSAFSWELTRFVQLFSWTKALSLG